MKLHRTPSITVVLGITAVFVAIGMMAAVIVPIEGSLWAEEKKKQVKFDCWNAQNECQQVCDYAFPTTAPGIIEGWDACTRSCQNARKDCDKGELESSKKSSDTGTTPVPPTKAGQSIGKVGGVKKQDPLKGASITQTDTGGSTVPKTKVGGVEQDWSSPSTTGGGTILMHRSKSKKN
jgi:hypothetical protein